MRTANPALQQFVQPQTWDRPGVRAAATPRTMTVAGTAIKAGILLAICAVVAVAVWSWANTAASPGVVFGPTLGAILAGVVLALVISFKPATAPFLAPIYAVTEGVFVGAVSWFVPYRYQVGEAVVFQAAGLTFGILLALLIAYSAGLVRLGSTATKVVTVATGGIAIYYLAILGLGLVGIGIPNLHVDASPLGIGFSILVICLASLNLVLDFQFIEAGVVRGAPKHMEWYGAFGLLVTLVWLYVETLRLLSKLGRE
jgi:uncharacterized YccA/Bax inhibitor family protein